MRALGKFSAVNVAPAVFELCRPGLLYCSNSAVVPPRGREHQSLQVLYGVLTSCAIYQDYQTL